tara:strand:+ start:135 stop:467 length:333 start_codon:yes stop_codon:yes gene_type:complete
MSNKFSRLQNDSDRLQTHLQIDDEKNKAEITYTQDIAAVLESNKIEREEYSHQTSHNDMQKVASIPNVVVMEWMQEGINVMNPSKECLGRIKKKLNSPDYAYLRTGGGRL